MSVHLLLSVVSPYICPDNKKDKMGDLHNMEKLKVSGHASGQMTGQQLADKLKKSPDAMRKYFVRVAEKRPDIFPDTSWSLDRPLTAEQVAALSGQKQRTKKSSFNPQRQSTPPAPDKTGDGNSARNFFDNWEFDAINLIEMGLIGWGTWLLYDVSGLFLAAMCCLFIYKTQKLVKQPKMEGSSEKSLEIVWWVCFASCGLHSITFYNSIEINHGGANDPLLYVHITAAFVPALFVSVFSYKAVATTRVITLEQ